MITLVESKLQKLMENHGNHGHDYDHFAAVRDHAIKAVKHEPDLNERQKLQIILAAFLHDADDYKIFPDNKNYDNAISILNDITNDKEFIEGIIEMISLVSCSKNGDSDVPDKWKLIPRDCDRLEALGEIGIKRCRDYNMSINRPLHINSTKRVYSMTELLKVATPDRFEIYQKLGKSDSMIDHYYDKILHIGNPERLKSQNKYILDIAAKRNHIMAEFVLNYWKHHNF